MDAGGGELKKTLIDVVALGADGQVERAKRAYDAKAASLDGLVKAVHDKRTTVQTAIEKEAALFSDQLENTYGKFFPRCLLLTMNTINYSSPNGPEATCDLYPRCPLRIRRSMSVSADGTVV